MFNIITKPVSGDLKQSKCYDRTARVGSIRRNVVATTTLIMCLIFIQTATGATYFIDYVLGHDTNDGQSTTTPWQRCPGMNGFVGRYVPAVGDTFIFCGGSTWPNSTMPFQMAGLGDPVTNTTYTSTNTWYHGSTWTMPCFDAERMIVAPINSIRSALYVSGTNITISDFEVKNLLIPQAPNWNGYGVASIGGSPKAKNITIRNCWLHDWRAGIDPSTPSGTDGDFGGIVFLNGAEAVTVVGNRIGPGLPPIGLKGNSGCGVAGSIATIASNIIFGVTEHINSGATNISFNDLGNSANSYDPVHHPNVIYHGLASNMKAWIFSNMIHDTDTRFQTMLLKPGYKGATNTAYYISGNIIYNITSPIDIDESGISIANSGTAAYIYNNTVVRTIAVAALKRNQPFHLSRIECKNNLWISDTTISNPIGTAASSSAFAPVNELVDVNNVWMRSPAAAQAGFTAKNRYLSRSADTIGKGLNFSSLGWCDLDISGTKRPPVGSWDIGGFEYKSFGTPPANPEVIP